MKKVRIIGLSILVCLMVSLVATSVAYAGSDKMMDVSRVDEVTRQIFGNVKIKSSEYLYGFNDSPDYIYVDFEDYGYAVYYSNTMELMEYAPVGSLPYDSAATQKYYAGPSNYFSRESEQFVNSLTGEKLHLSKAEAMSYSQQLSEVFSLNSVSRQDYLLEVESQMNTDGEITRHSSDNTSPDIDTDALITADPPGTAGTTYIPNAQYFTPTNPTHGFNTHGTCGSVAAQLLLSYNNFYNDRRIIAPEHLNGGWNNSTGNGNMHDPANYTTSANNPNVSIDPTSVTRQTTGTNDDFYNHVIGAIEPGAFNCTCTNTRVTITGSTATVTVTITRPDGTSTVTTTTRPANSGETSSSNTTHTHNGSSTTAVRNGLRNILGQRIANNEYTVNSDEKGWFFGWSPISSTPIKNEINAGRPVIIGMSSNLGGNDHWVVGYGYQNYTYPGTTTVYSGYIVHFGWTGFTRTWINESWCNAYITMQMNHTHNHNIDTGNNVGNDKREVRCTCGHRTTDNLFNISGSMITRPTYQLSGSITIPSTINGTTITAIGSSAFANCSQLSQISIPESVTNIGSNAFENCTSLTSITLSNSLTSIGSSAFKGCASLSSITIPDSITDIDQNTFENCTSLISVSLFNNLTRIGNSAFKGCESLSTITIPDSVASIGANSFENCTRLTSITLPNSLISITDYLFFNCSELKNIKVPSAVTNIGAGAFSGCSSLTSITIPKSVSNIDLYAFENCLNLKSVTVQREFVDAITILGTNVFDGCSSLKGIIVPINSTNDYKNATNWSFYSAIICCYEQHDYTYLLDSNNHDQHIGKCDCGHTHISNHNYNSFGICIDCGYEHEHTYTYSSGINDDGSFYHTKYCYGCGYSIDESHTFVNGVCECGFHENTVETVWQEGAVISSGSSITLLKTRMNYQLVKLYTVDFGEIYVNVGFTTTILLLGGEEYGFPFEQLRIDLFENGMVLYFNIVQIEGGYEYPYPYVWSEYPFYLNKVEFIG